MTPVVSVITPVYNAEKYLEESMESIIHQTYVNWEHLIIDDGSTDDTIQIANRFAEQDARIQIIQLEQRAGIANARNVGVQNARGKYIAFLDSDDVWLPDKLEKQVAFAEENKIDFLYTPYEVMDEDGRYVKTITPYWDKVDYKHLLRTNCIACLTVLIKRELLIKHPMPKMPHEDYATWLSILCDDVPQAVMLDRITARYRTHKDSISADKRKTIRWNWNIYRHNQGLSFFQSVRYVISFVIMTGMKYLKR